MQEAVIPASDGQPMAYSLFVFPPFPPYVLGPTEL
jgi:hypothetical protein